MEPATLVALIAAVATVVGAIFGLTGALALGGQLIAKGRADRREEKRQVHEREKDEKRQAHEREMKRMTLDLPGRPILQVKDECLYTNRGYQ